MNAKDIGTKLKELRGDKSIAEVSHATGIGESALRNYEGGLRVPRDYAKIKLADYYGVPVGDLFFPADLHETSSEEATE